MLSMGYTICIIVVCAFVAIFDFQERLSSKSGEISWKYFTGCSDGNSGYLLPSCR